MFTATNVLNREFIEQPLDTLWALISPLYMVDETQWLRQLLPLATPSEDEQSHIQAQTTSLIQAIRADKNSVQMIDALLLEYSLDTQEGILLMCLAEALMRIPDHSTADALIRDKLSVADWKSHLTHSDSVFVNASTWGLMLTGKVVGLSSSSEPSPIQAVNRLVNKLSEPVIRQAMHQAMKIMGHQFVLGRSISEAQKNARPFVDKGFCYSFDMLGEAALTAADANKYFKDYLMAIESVGRESKNSEIHSDSVSIKLSALHPRYEVANQDRVIRELYDTVLSLLERAVELDVAITIDAEEADRLELSLVLFEKLYRSSVVKGWGKLGLVIQTYSKRALPVLVWLNRLAKEQGDMIPLRLVKGAYWDSEIKWSQQSGYANYPVYTRKESTDVAYLACARFLLSEGARGHLWPQFASHNAHTVTTIAVMAQHSDYEFQRLHGMGESLYHHVMAMYHQPVRIYAPVGSHKDLLPYLVRRLLENGANSSFVHRLVDARCPVESLTRHPVDSLMAHETMNNPHIPLPPFIFPERKNSRGINVDIESELAAFEPQVTRWLTHQWQASPIIDGEYQYESMIKGNNAEVIAVSAPFDRRISVGSVAFSRLDHASAAIDVAQAAFPDWQKTTPSKRAALLENLADLLEDNLAELVALCHQEAGKTIHDGIDEVREAVDFCRFYAKQADTLNDVTVAGFDGEPRPLQHRGRGVFVCISPWNFPLAIFLGQITAALVAGNCVVAKPAEQTSLIAARAVTLMLQAGFPTGVIQLLPGRGRDIGRLLTEHPHIAGVAFTGSTQTAQQINQTLANRDCASVPLMAETGGQNAMIVDSTALPEQVVRDVIRSAFASAGQRCSALRVLFVQEDIADRIIALIQGAMHELSVGNPQLHSTDVGPVIDAQAKHKLAAHVERMTAEHKVIAKLSLDETCQHGDFVAPCAFEIEDISELKEEQFGPILHVVRFKASELANVVANINATGFGLTLGIHSRNETTYRWIEKHAQVGNSYINRDQVGAVVGVQPFGGQGLSGTGPKAGGPHYLYRFSQLCHQQHS